MDHFDRDRKLISNRLYRHNADRIDINGSVFYIKDLSKVGRDLSKSIIIDNLKDNFCRQPRNGIQITTWKHNQLDRELRILQELLLQMIKD